MEATEKEKEGINTLERKIKYKSIFNLCGDIKEKLIKIKNRSGDEESFLRMFNTYEPHYNSTLGGDEEETSLEFKSRLITQGKEITYNNFILLFYRHLKKCGMENSI